LPYADVTPLPPYASYDMSEDMPRAPPATQRRLVEAGAIVAADILRRHAVTPLMPHWL